MYAKPTQQYATLRQSDEALKTYGIKICFGIYLDVNLAGIDHWSFLLVILFVLLQGISDWHVLFCHGLFNLW